MAKNPKSIYDKILQADKTSTVNDIVNKERSKRIRVHMPCKVVAINGSTVDVEIQGQEDTGFGYYSKFPLLLDLPIIYNNYTLSAYIITPVQVGDTGLVEFLDFNSSNFNSDGNAIMSSDSGYHSLNNGVFINGYIPTTESISISSDKAIVMGLHNNTFVLNVNDTGDLEINGLSINLKADTNINVDTSNFTCSNTLVCQGGANGVFNTTDGKTVTVKGGIITKIQ